MKIDSKDKYNVTVTMTESELKELYSGSFEEYHNKVREIVAGILETIDNNNQ